MSRKFNAILGLGALAAFGFASSAFAQCPTGPVPPWSSQSALLGSVAISAGGYDATSCKLDTAITGNAGSAVAAVIDNTPADEPTYRAQFLVNVEALTNQNTTQPVRVFAATTDTPANGIPALVSLSIYGNGAGTQKILGISTVDGAAVQNTTATLTGGTAGVHRIEIAYTKGGAGVGELKVWVNSTDPNTSTVTLATNNSAWGGVDAAALGLAAPSANYRALQLNKIVSFDEFDSRRTSFIGN